MVAMPPPAPAGPLGYPRALRGRSSMAEQEPSKLKTGVRFSSPASSEHVYEQVQEHNPRTSRGIAVHVDTHADDASSLWVEARVEGSWLPLVSGDSHSTRQGAFDEIKSVLGGRDYDDLRRSLGADTMRFSIMRWGADGLAEAIWTWSCDGDSRALRQLLDGR